MNKSETELILETYDSADNKRKIINSLSKMLRVSSDEIIESLQQNGREVPLTESKKPGRPKVKSVINIPEEVKKSIDSFIQEPEKKEELPMPEFVRDVLFREVSRLEKQLDQIRTEYEETQKNYMSLRDYLKL